MSVIKKAKYKKLINKYVNAHACGLKMDLDIGMDSTAVSIILQVNTVEVPLIDVDLGNIKTFDDIFTLFSKTDMIEDINSFFNSITESISSKV